MTTNHILFIDDDDRTNHQHLKRLLNQENLTFSIIHPEDVLQRDISKAKVVVVDYFLEKWSERDDSSSLARAPRDGLAVAATLRSTQLPSLADRGPGVYPHRPIAFALWSGHLSEATFNLPDVVLPHAFSRENNLEWAFRRNELTTPRGAEQLAELCRAVDSAAGWSDARSESNLFMEFLGFRPNDLPLWAGEAVEAALDCRPPLQELASSTHGMALVRWMLHRVIPYPTFLMSERELQLRLSIVGLPTDYPRLAEELTAVRYSGTLSNFEGPRWWRIAVEEWLYERSDGNSSDPGSVARLMESFDADTREGALRQVLTLNEDLSYEPDAVDVEDVVRARPEDWPPYAEPAYVRTALAAENADIRRIVDASDADIVLRYNS